MKFLNLYKINVFFLSSLLISISSNATAKDFRYIGMCRASIDGLYAIYEGNLFDKLSMEAIKTIENNIALSKKLSPIFYDCLDSYVKDNPESKSVGSDKLDGKKIFASCNKDLNKDETNYLIGYFFGMHYIVKEIQKRSGFDLKTINLMCLAGRD